MQVLYKWDELSQSDKDLAHYRYILRQGAREDADDVFFDFVETEGQSMALQHAISISIPSQEELAEMAEAYNWYFDRQGCRWAAVYDEEGNAIRYNKLA